EELAAEPGRDPGLLGDRLALPVQGFSVGPGSIDLLQPATGGSRVRESFEIAHDPAELTPLVEQLAPAPEPGRARARGLEQARDERRIARATPVLHRQELEPLDGFAPDRGRRPFVA